MTAGIQRRSYDQSTPPNIYPYMYKRKNSPDRLAYRVSYNHKHYGTYTTIEAAVIALEKVHNDPDFKAGRVYRRKGEIGPVERPRASVRGPRGPYKPRTKPLVRLGKTYQPKLQLHPAFRPPKLYKRKKHDLPTYVATSGGRCGNSITAKKFSVRLNRWDPTSDKPTRYTAFCSPFPESCVHFLNNLFGHSEQRDDWLLRHHRQTYSQADAPSPTYYPFLNQGCPQLRSDTQHTDSYVSNSK